MGTSSEGCKKAPRRPHLATTPQRSEQRRSSTAAYQPFCHATLPSFRSVLRANCHLDSPPSPAILAAVIGFASKSVARRQKRNLPPDSALTPSKLVRNLQAYV